ncbi:MAG: gamma carbonic anhydrase family protein [Methanobacteriota archaeon]|nr:MAG: gamma carbonic anhydrase family protein [Euryarchaeota archaeon]
MTLRSFGARKPTIEEGAYVDPDSMLIGDVTIRASATVWPFALLRADDDTIEVGEGSAVMDMAFIEAPSGRPVKVGRGCIISHGAKLHGSRVEDGAMVGIGAMMLDEAVLEKGAILAAGSILPPGKRVAAMTLARGSPAKMARKVTDADREDLLKGLEALRAKAEQYGRKD